MRPDGRHEGRTFCWVRRRAAVGVGGRHSPSTFGETHQELAGANAARDELLGRLGFINVVFFADLPNKIQSADQDAVRGHVLSNGIDGNGRLIAFVYPGDHPGPDGMTVFVDEALVDQSLNAQLLAAGHAYPAFYATLPADLRTHLAKVSEAARAAQPPVGLWPRSTADPDGPATIANLDGLQQLVIWPKLFRRIVPYLAAGFGDFNGFDAWLRADPVNRDDELFLLWGGRRSWSGRLTWAPCCSGSESAW
jgi:hypothetical protein